MEIHKPVHDLRNVKGAESGVVSVARAVKELQTIVGSLVDWVNQEEKLPFGEISETLHYEAVFDGDLSDAPFSTKAADWEYPDKGLQAEFYKRFCICPDDRIIVWKKPGRDYFSVTHVRRRSQ